MNDRSIRLARDDEHAAIAACVNAAYARYVPRIGRQPAPMRADYAALIHRRAVYVIFGEDGVRGVVVVLPAADHFLIENVAVHPARQGTGLGTRLMRFAEELAVALGLGEARLYTHELMTENIAYYRKLGYEAIDRRNEDGYRRVYFRKTLNG